MYVRKKEDKVPCRKYDHEYICKLAEEGKTVEEITRIIKAKGRSLVLEVLTMNNAPIRHELIDHGKIMALRNAKWTVSQIAEEMKLPAQIIKEAILAEMQYNNEKH